MPPNENAPGQAKKNDGQDEAAPPTTAPAPGTVMLPTGFTSLDSIGTVVKVMHYNSLPAGDYIRQYRQYGGTWVSTSPNVTGGPGIDIPINLNLGGPEGNVDWQLVKA